MNDDELIEAMLVAMYDDGCPGAVDSMRAVLAVVRAHDRDGERYRWLRDTVQWSYPSAEGSDDRDAYLVITGYDFHYGKPTAGDVVDAAVDEAIARGKE